MNRKFHLVFCGALILCAGLFSSTPAKVRQDHPRIFVNNDPAYDNSVAALRERVRRPPFLAEYERLTMWRNSFDDVPRGRKPANVLPSYAIRWVIDSLDTAAADTALSMMLALEEDDGQSWNLSVMAVAYDWLYRYPGFTGPKKELVRGRMVRFAESTVRALSRGDDVFNNHTFYHLRAVFLASLALAGEVPQAEQWLAFAKGYFRENIQGALELLDGGWHEGLSYSSRASLLNVGMWMEALESATTPAEDFFGEMKKDGDWLNRFTAFYAGQVLPDGTLARYNDLPEYVTDGGWDNSRLFMIVAREYKNGLAAWILRRILDRNLQLMPLHIWYYLLWYDPAVPVTPPEKVLGTSLRYCPGTYDLFFMRSSWDDNATVVSFHAGDWFGSHDHLDAGHFSIFRQKPLAIDAGTYAPMDQVHHQDFYHRTLAHNCLLVYDPQEHFQVPGGGTEERFNDGGQRVVVSLGGRSTQINRTAEIWKNNRIEGYHFDRATVLDWYASGDLDFVRADITHAYNSDFFCGYGRGRTNRPKVESVFRSLAFVRPSTVVVYDFVKSKDPSFKKTWILNAPDQPYLDDGNVFMVLDSPARLAGKTFMPEKTEREIWGSYSRPFYLGGRGMIYGIDLTGYPAVTPGGWIVRISPAEENLTDEFLHLLVAGDAGSTAGDLLGAWKLLRAEGARVLTDNAGLVLVFPVPGQENRLSFDLEYSGTSRVRVLGLPGDKIFYADRDGRAVAENLRPEQGVLLFDLPGGGKITVRAKD